MPTRVGSGAAGGVALHDWATASHAIGIATDVNVRR